MHYMCYTDYGNLLYLSNKNFIYIVLLFTHKIYKTNFILKWQNKYRNNNFFTCIKIGWLMLNILFYSHIPSEAWFSILYALILLCLLWNCMGLCSYQNLTSVFDPHMWTQNSIRNSIINV